jgi:uracil-DNA glycosylase
MEQLPSIIHESWHPFLQPIFDNDFSLQLIKNQILPTNNFYPEKHNIFRVFSMPIQDIKVVILGQDPYPNENQAIGYAFAVNQNCKAPASLRIISRELSIEGFETGSFNDYLSDWKNLSHWVDQGVFLLNTALTVEKKKAGSHLNLWVSFTRQIIRIISKEVNPVWLLWGAKAQLFIPYIQEIGSWENHIVIAPHPAAETYSGGKAGFYGSDCFNHVNLLLEEVKNKSVIKW